jgi:hypothetical protein
MSKPVLVFVGGFLGAGKTTLILTAARKLAADGRKSAVILNDQSTRVADAPLLEAEGLRAEEIGGGCFCCRFSDLMDGAEEVLRAGAPDVIFAEPVGSCTDISATVLQPIKALYQESYILAPYTVVADATALASRKDMDPSLEYLFRKQLEEADLVCLNKVDLLTDVDPGSADFMISAKTGAGIDAWLSTLLNDHREIGSRLLDVDYELYAKAEASLGWLNWQGDLTFEEPVLPSVVVGRLLDEIDGQLTKLRTPVAHLKVVDAAGGEVLKASIVRNGQEPSLSGNLLAEGTKEHSVYLNLRAKGDPDILRATVEEALAELPCRALVTNVFDSFRPAAPVPQHRYKSVI